LVVRELDIDGRPNGLCIKPPEVDGAKQ
jgi:hypothetical protein